MGKEGIQQGRCNFRQREGREGGWEFGKEGDRQAGIRKGKRKKKSVKATGIQ